jgi:hypothetical protein
MCAELSQNGLLTDLHLLVRFDQSAVNHGTFENDGFPL